MKTASYYEAEDLTKPYRKLTYTYTGDGQLYSVHDSKTGLTYQYSYDSLGRLMSGSVIDSSGNVVFSTRQTYDSNNQLSGQQWRIGGTTYSETYTYSKTTGMLATHKPAVGNTLSYGYDELQRLKEVTGGVYSKYYSYWDGSGNSTTNLLSQLTYDLPADITYAYSYDANGNILFYADNGTLYTYTYDAQNQLTQQAGDGKTYTYTYDAAGNILTASNGTTSHTYTYGDTKWRDLLTKFDGHTISYDASGNPTTYYNGTEWDMDWTEGRRLVSASSGTTSLDFTYDSDGLRLSKTVNDSTTYSYHYAGGKLLRQTGGSNTLDFFYDASGNPYALKYNNTLYYYITNLQGDVLHIVNTSGTPVVSYSYSPYGAIENVTGDLATSLGVHNPLRYRGYVYDEETELYYLQSRYYDPSTCRFINADNYVSTGQDVLGYNMYTYCLNNPIVMLDQTGESPANIIGGIFGGITGAALGYLLAEYLGLTGWKKVALIAAATAGGAALGVFLGPYVAKLGQIIAAKVGLATAAKVAYDSISKISKFKMQNHINVAKHLWEKVLKDPTDKAVEQLIMRAIKYGEWEAVKGEVYKITYKFAGEIITVTGRIIDGIFNISDAWVNR